MVCFECCTDCGLTGEFSKDQMLKGLAETGMQVDFCQMWN